MCACAKRIGGYRQEAIGEDLDVVTRLHRHLREQESDYHISFVPDPVCWTEVPSDLRSLGLQRARWQKGLTNVLWTNRRMLLNPRYGRIGLVAMPYHWVFEMLAPLIEVVGYSTMLIAALVGVLDRHFFIQFLLFGYAFATMISIGAVLQEEITYRRYNDWRDMLRLLCFCFLEHFPYRQLQMWWRLKGMWQYLRGDVGWGRMQRVGFRAATDVTPASCFPVRLWRAKGRPGCGAEPRAGGSSRNADLWPVRFPVCTGVRPYARTDCKQRPAG